MDTFLRKATDVCQGGTIWVYTRLLIQNKYGITRGWGLISSTLSHTQWAFEPCPLVSVRLSKPLRWPVAPYHGETGQKCNNHEDVSRSCFRYSDSPTTECQAHFRGLCYLVENVNILYCVWVMIPLFCDWKWQRQIGAVFGWMLYVISQWRLEILTCFWNFLPIVSQYTTKEIKQRWNPVWNEEKWNMYIV